MKNHTPHRISVRNSSSSARSCSFLFLFAFIFLVFSSAQASAEQQSLGYVRTGSCIALKQSFGNSTFQNITAVTLPDKLNINIINKNMQSLGGGLYNYTFCGTHQIGEYVVDGIGNVNGAPETWTYNFYANPLGIPNTFIFYTLFLAVIVLIFMLGHTIKNPYIIMLDAILIVIMGLFVIVNGIDMVKNVLYTRAIGIVLWALGVYIMYLAVQEFLKEWD